MNAETYGRLIEAADRMWAAARALDARTGGTAWYEHVGERVRDLVRSGRAADIDAVLAIARVLERRLDVERRSTCA